MVSLAENGLVMARLKAGSSTGGQLEESRGERLLEEVGDNGGNGGGGPGGLADQLGTGDERDGRMGMSLSLKPVWKCRQFLRR